MISKEFSENESNKKSTFLLAIIQNSLNSWNEAHERKMTLKNSMYSLLMRGRYISHCPMNLIRRFLWNQYKDKFLKYFFGDLEYQFEFHGDLIAPTSYYLSGSFTFSKDVKLNTNTV